MFADDRPYERLSQKYSNELDVIYSHYKKVVCYLMGRGLSYEDAQDATQEAYMDAIENIATLKDIDNAKSWLYTIAWRKAMRYLNKNKKHKEKEIHIDDPIEYESIQTAVNCEEEFAAALGISDNHELCNAMKQLSNRERQVLGLYYVCELRFKDIAQMMEINESTARTISKRAKEKLRRLLEEERQRYNDI